MGGRGQVRNCHAALPVMALAFVASLDLKALGFHASNSILQSTLMYFFLFFCTT